MPKLSIKEILKPTLALLAICVVITGALAGVNAITKEPIAQNARQEADAARQAVFPEADRFEDHGNYVTALSAAQVLGYAIETSAQGYGGEIKAMVALSPEGRVLQVRILAADSETPGLGQNVKGEGFLRQFVGAAGSVALGHGDSDSTAGATPASAEKNIDAVASATYSSRGVVNAVNRALEIYAKMGAKKAGPL